MRREIASSLDGAAIVDGVSAEDIPAFTKKVRRAGQC